MKCFHFSNGEKKEEPHTIKSGSARSSSTASYDLDMRRSGSEINSQNASDVSAESVGRSQYPSLSQRSSNLRVFTFSELRAATKNFSRSLMIGEGGFGCVYRGTIRSSEDANTKMEIAVKQLNRKGLQASLLFPAMVSFNFSCPEFDQILGLL